MILGLYAVLVVISLALITIGLIRPTESAQSLIGFFFLFLLAITMLNGNVEIETGSNITFSYDQNLSISSQTISYRYGTFSDSNSKNIGLYLAIGSAVGFAGILFNIARTQWGKE